MVVRVVLGGGSEVWREKRDGESHMQVARRLRLPARAPPAVTLVLPLSLLCSDDGGGSD
jgi:hypothetical protein